MLSQTRWKLIGVTAIVLTGCTQDRPSEPSFQQKTLQADLETAQKTTNIVGLLAEVETPDGSVRARAGVSEIGQSDPVPWDAVFRVASTTKAFVATALLQLVGEGKLSLEDPVEKWLPGVVSGNGNNGAKITVRQLLQHTSGIFDYVIDPDLRAAFAADLPGACRDTSPPETWVAIAMKHPPLFAPGTSWSYSNTNYLLAGMIIQKITGHAWQDEITTRIITPLGLAHTSLTGADPTLPGPHAHSYIIVPGAPAPIDATECALLHTADSAVISTTSDLNTFFRALVTGKLLPREQLTAMQDTVPATDDDDQFPGGRYGLGLRWSPLSCGGGYWHHEGDSPTGFFTRTGVTPDGLRSVAISMTSTIDLTATNAAIARLTDHALCDTSMP